MQNGAMFGVVARERFLFWPKLRTAPRTGRVHSTTDHAICTARRPRRARVRGAGPSKTKEMVQTSRADGRSETNADPECGANSLG